MNDLEKIFLIDLDMLEQHWREQPGLVYEWGKRVGELKIKLEEESSSLEELYANLDLHIRQNPGDYDIKLTETAISNLIKTRPEYQKKMEKVREVKEEFEKAKAVLNALEHRKAALENLVKLHGQQYFALPEVKKIDIREINKDVVKKKIKSKTNRRVK